MARTCSTSKTELENEQALAIPLSIENVGLYMRVVAKQDRFTPVFHS